MRMPFYYRVLLFVFAIAGVAGLIEYSNATNKSADRDGGPQSAERRIGDADAMLAIYPARAETEFYRGSKEEAILLQQDRKEAVSEAFLIERRRRLAEVAEHYERALAGGIKSNEDLHYDYALTLMRLDAPPEKIKKAITRWRETFPNSRKPDLESWREAISQQNLQLAALSAQMKRESERDQRRRALEELYSSPKRAP